MKNKEQLKEMWRAIILLVIEQGVFICFAWFLAEKGVLDNYPLIKLPIAILYVIASIKVFTIFGKAARKNQSDT